MMYLSPYISFQVFTDCNKWAAVNINFYIMITVSKLKEQVLVRRIECSNPEGDSIHNVDNQLKNINFVPTMIHSSADDYRSLNFVPKAEFH